MKRVLLLVAALAFLDPSQAYAGIILADLSNDFSFTNNPNSGPYGTWSYNAGNTPLAKIDDWQTFGGPTGVAGWGPAANQPGDYIPFWTRVTSQDQNTNPFG